ncbi:polymer-forming cytoskeletal protein [Paraburkholderia humisilvae]|uniref:Polymer-forming cytoskeletal protein n=1 Tax=Paraburkholderia humisilvae TaxID=627669 RepID=A0A6J5EQD3_9BURK|nr:polymer-forming cytoskeletal protein [Paraburkholderia humisilvae]CAB3767436.1 hypothetical protein LMG29542_05607 [Paraburkholderia humisilvae]
MSNATSNDQQVDVVSFVLNIDPVRERVTTVFPAGATIESDGSLRLKEGGRIGGVIKGNVYSESGTLVIDRDAIIEGSVFAKGRCLIFGQVGLPNRKALIRCEMVDGLLVSHFAQLHADVQHNGLSATNVGGQIQRIADVGVPVVPATQQEAAATWQPPGQQTQRDQVPPQHQMAGAPLALPNSPSPIANFTAVPLRVVVASEPDEGRAGEQHQQGYVSHSGYASGNRVPYSG